MHVARRAAMLREVRAVVRHQARLGSGSLLQCDSSNKRATSLYEHLGLCITGLIDFVKVNVSRCEQFHSGIEAPKRALAAPIMGRAPPRRPSAADARSEEALDANATTVPVFWPAATRQTNRKTAQDLIVRPSNVR